jgi:molybdate transport system substrate-binding protein
MGLPLILLRIFASLVLVAITMVMPLSARADDVPAAVAANFAAPMKAIAAAFTEATGHHVSVSTGSTGALAAQIANGAPFEVFLAADAAAPARLESDGLAVAGTRRIYAVGRLALWSAKEGFVDATGAVLGTGVFVHLAIANPKLAPYGAAAVASLRKLGLLAAIEPRFVQGGEHCPGLPVRCQRQCRTRLRRPVAGLARRPVHLGLGLGRS